jgi:hypothetical protein
LQQNKLKEEERIATLMSILLFKILFLILFCCISFFTFVEKYGPESNTSPKKTTKRSEKKVPSERYSRKKHKDLLDTLSNVETVRKIKL